MIRVGYLGPEATFTNMAVSRFFPEAEHVPYRTIPDCIDAAANENVDYRGCTVRERHRRFS